MNTFIILVIELLTFAIVAATSLAAIRLVGEFLSIRRRMAIGSTVYESRSSARVLKTETVTNPFLSWVQSFTSLNDPADRGKLQRTLSLAGFESVAAPAIYVAVRYGLALGLPICFLIAQRFVANPMTGVWPIFGALGLCGLGLLAPSIVVDRLAGARKARLEEEFPDALDLMVVCIDAGLGLESAFVRVGQEIGESHRRITTTFNRVSEEMSAGRGRAEALRAMADHANVESVASFAALIIQTEALGVSVGQTLRIFSQEMRETRLLKAEEKAMRIPVLMTIPVVACFLPVIVSALLLPPMIDVMRTMLPAMAGHPH